MPERRHGTLGRLLVIMMLVPVPPGAVAQGADGRGIEGVIGMQFDAFRSKDAAKAFTYASPMIQSMFGSPEDFGRMVQGGYPMIWDPSGVEYRGLRVENGLTLQRVRVRDASGKDFMFDYEMLKGPAGWRINGVYPVRDPGAGV
ncbi:MAG: DUF4864 domain-containing protein [Pseudomonadota bacterium]